MLKSRAEGLAFLNMTWVLGMSICLCFHTGIPFHLSLEHGLNSLAAGLTGPVASGMKKSKQVAFSSSCLGGINAKKKAQRIYGCTECCGATFSKWAGQCAECQAWNYAGGNRVIPRDGRTGADV